MSIPVVIAPQGTRVRIRRAQIPQDARTTGRTGTVISTSEYRVEAVGVALDGDPEIHYFLPAELEIIEERALPPEREQAKLRRALP